MPEPPQLRCEHQLDVVAGAAHLFEEAGALDQIADLARDWFLAHLGRKRSVLRRSTVR